MKPPPTVARERTPARAMAPAVLAFTMCLLPAFLPGTLAPELQGSLHFDSTQLGAAVAAFFATAALVSVPLGRVAERIGATRAMRGALLVSATTMALAAASTSWWHLVAALALGGVAQALVDPAANLHLARQVPAGRLGLAMGVKQSAAPVATIAGGLAVPLVALPLGWRWVFLLGASGALVAAFTGPRVIPGARPAPAAPAGRPSSFIVLLAVGAFLAGATAAAVSTFLVDSAVHQGISVGRAGLLAACGGVIGIVARIGSGVWSDRPHTAHLRAVVGLLLVGGPVCALMGSENPWVISLAAPLAFVTAWGWSALVHFVVVRSHPDAPSAATGVLNTGACGGAVLGPIAFGAIADRGSYSLAWLVAGGMTLLAALVVALAGRTSVGLGLRGAANPLEPVDLGPGGSGPIL